MKIRPIRNESDHQEAMEEVARLWNSAPGSAEADRLEVLSTLIDAYEDANHPVPPPDPIDAIRFYMEQEGMTAKDLEPLIGTRSRVWEVLNRKRRLSLAMIRRLNRKLGIPAEILVRPSTEHPKR